MDSTAGMFSLVCGTSTSSSRKLLLDGMLFSQEFSMRCRYIENSFKRYSKPHSDREEPIATIPAQGIHIPVGDLG